MSLHIFRLIILAFVNWGQISMVLFTECLYLGVVSVSKTAITSLGLEFKVSADTILPDPRIKLPKMEISIILNEVRRVSSVLTISSFSAMNLTLPPSVMKQIVDIHIL